MIQAAEQFAKTAIDQAQQVTVNNGNHPIITLFRSVKYPMGHKPQTILFEPFGHCLFGAIHRGACHRSFARKASRCLRKHEV